MGRILRALRVAVAVAVIGAGLAVACGYLAARGAAQGVGQEGVTLTGAWRGAYACGQGVTGLTLTIETDAYGLTATFDFYAVRDNPHVPTGRFRMVGTYDSRARVLVLHPREWIVQPPGYFPVGMKAHVDLEWGVMLGTIVEDARSCSWVRLSRDRRPA
jgi:hypothetical protein